MATEKTQLHQMGAKKVITAQLWEPHLQQKQTANRARLENTLINSANTRAKEQSVQVDIMEI